MGIVYSTNRKENVEKNLVSAITLVTARNTPFPLFREQTGPSLPVPTDQAKKEFSTCSIRVDIWDRENALVSTVLYMFIVRCPAQ